MNEQVELAPKATGTGLPAATMQEAARGRLQVVISDEGFEAGRPNTVSIVVTNPFDSAIEVLDIQAPQSSYLGSWIEEKAIRQQRYIQRDLVDENRKRRQQTQTGSSLFRVGNPRFML